MSAILEYMLQPGNEDVETVEITSRQRRLRRKERYSLIITPSPSIKIEHKKGMVLYTAGRKIEYKSEREKNWLSQFPQTNDDNVVRE